MMETGLLFVSLIPLLVLFGLVIWSWRRNVLLRTVILCATLIHELLLVVFPAWYSVLTDFELEGIGNMQAMVGADELLLVMIGESIFVLMFALACVVGWPRPRLQGNGSALAASGQSQARCDRLAIYILVILGCLVYAPKIIQPLSAFQGGTGWTVEQMFVWIQGIFGFTSLIACALVLTRRRVMLTNPVGALLAAIPLLALLVIGFTVGIRGRILWVVSLLVVAGILNRQTRFVALGVMIGIILIPLFAFLGGAYRYVMQDDLMTGTARQEMVTRLYEEGKNRVAGDLKDMTDEFLYSMAWRAQGPRNSVILYRQYDNGTGPGFTTYSGSIFFPIPRLVWPEKPAVGSTDGTLYSSAIYQVMEVAYGMAGSMGPILASAYAYWEGGWGWLVAAGFITGLFWNIIFNLCRRLPEGMASVVALAFAAALLIDGMLTMLAPLYALIVAWWQLVLPVLIIYWVVSWLLPRKGLRLHAK